MTTRRKFLQLLGMAPVAPSILKIPPAMAAIPEPTVEKIVNYVEQEIIKPRGVLVANRLHDITELTATSEMSCSEALIPALHTVEKLRGPEEKKLFVECAIPNASMQVGEEVSLHVDKNSFLYGVGSGGCVEQPMNYKVFFGEGELP